jgi:hypothetical protein
MLLFSRPPQGIKIRFREFLYGFVLKRGSISGALSNDSKKRGKKPVFGVTAAIIPPC